MRRSKRRVETKSVAQEGGFINVAVSKTTRAGLIKLKQAMGLRNQAEVIERLVPSELRYNGQAISVGCTVRSSLIQMGKHGCVSGFGND